MTLQSSGSMTWADIANELGRALPVTVGDDETNWLADKSSGAAVIVPTDFHGKQSLKVVDQVGPSALGTTHSFTGVNFGTAYSGRSLHTLLFFMTKESDVTSGWEITGMSVGDLTQSGSIPMNWWQGGSGVDELAGTAMPSWQDVSGSSGTISLNTGQKTRVYCVVVSSPSAFPTDFDDSDESDLSGVPGLIPNNVDVTSTGSGFSNGGVLSMCCWRNVSQTLTLPTGATLKDTVSGVVTGYQVGWGWQNRLASETGREVKWGHSGAFSQSGDCATRTVAFHQE